MEQNFLKFLKIYCKLADHSKNYSNAPGSRPTLLDKILLTVGGFGGFERDCVGLRGVWRCWVVFGRVERE